MPEGRTDPQRVTDGGLCFWCAAKGRIDDRQAEVRCRIKRIDGESRLGKAQCTRPVPDCLPLTCCGEQHKRIFGSQCGCYLEFPFRRWPGPVVLEQHSAEDGMRSAGIRFKPQHLVGGSSRLFIDFVRVEESTPRLAMQAHRQRLGSTHE